MARFCRLAGLVALLTALVLTGCPRDQSSIDRTSAELPVSPGVHCVEDALASVAGVTQVRHEFEQGSRPLTLSGLQAPDAVHRYWYEYAGIRNNLYVVVSYDGRATVHNGYRCEGCSREVFEKLYPLMLNLEEAMERSCKLPGLVRLAREVCSGTGCSGD